MTDRMFAQLKPARLDELTEAAHSRHRADDLARAFRTPPAPPKAAVPFRRRPLLLSGGLVAAGLAAAVIVAPHVAPQPGPAPSAALSRTVATRPAALDARSVLLAAAESAARTPASTGRYWYTRERTFSRVRVDEDAYVAKLKALAAERDRRAASGSKEAADRWLDAQVSKLKKTSDLAYAAYSGSTDESWRARAKGDVNRNVRRSDGKITFGSPEDEEKWRSSGSPRLIKGGRTVDDDRLDRVLSIDNPSLTIRNVDRLPTGEKAFGRRLHELYRARPSGGTDEDFSVYLWQTAVDLLNAPITPGTRAALFRVLAGEQGLTALGERADSLGRTGAALAATEPGDHGESIEYRIIVDPGSGRLLQYEVAGDGASAPYLRVTLEDAGWVDALGRRP
ncbi:CU044_5270 family protein [Microbispora rosea]|uniref:CU044_5270 family protein n=1 Tax=Microbispora rosea TaxID=58117 RepID=UPI0036AA8D0C